MQINYKVYTADGLGGTFFDDMQKANLKKKVNVSGDDGTGNKKPEEEKNDRANVTAKPKIEDLAKKSTNKPANVKGDPENVMLGRDFKLQDENGNFLLDKNGNQQLADNNYRKLAEDMGCWYYHMDDAEWMELRDKYGEEYMWSINQQFIDEMAKKNKTFLFSVDPTTAPKESAYYREYQYITEILKYKNIKEIWE